MKVPWYSRMSFVASMVLLLAAAAPRAHAQVTPPQDYLGFTPGADFHLITYAQAIGYFELLASQSERIQLFDMGPTSGMRRMKYGVISSAENLARLERYKEINRKLSLVTGISRAEADDLADEGRVIVWIDGGLHGTEVAPAQLLPQLAYELVAREDRTTQMIRRDVIVLLVFANPDGMTIVSDWYMGNVGTPYEVSPLPWLYHRYVGHDNNRDSFIANLVETQNMNRATSQEWFPEILYNQHQTGPFPARIWIPPDAEPTNPNVHPMLVRWKNLIGAAMGKAFDEANQPGAISRIRYDTWYPGYATQVVDGKNTVSILTETQLYRYATPQFFSINDFPEAHRDLVKGVFYPNPWRGGWWRIGDAVAYNKTACYAILETASKYRYEMLFNKWRMGKDVVERFLSEPPYGWIFPANQRDTHSAALLLNRCILNGLEVYQAEEDFSHNGIDYAAGSYIIPASQPFGLFAKNIFEKQRYPDLREYAHLWQGIVGTADVADRPLRAYDGAGWTLPLQMGVEYREMSEALEVKRRRISRAATPRGELRGSGPHYVFSHADNGSYIALNRLFSAGGTASVALSDFTIGGESYPRGTFVAAANSINGAALEDIAAQVGAVFHGGRVRADMQSLSRPRIGLYKSWVANMDAGWISLLLERYEFPFDFITDAEIRAGRLKSRFEIIVLPDQRANSIINGHRKGTMPPDYVGGISSDGVAHLREFVESGGILLCNKGSCDFAIEQFNLPLRNVLQGVKADSFSCPGSILKMEYDTAHPLAFGMEKRGMAFFSGGRVFEVLADSAAQKQRKTTGAVSCIAHYPDEHLLLSGWIAGDEALRDKAAVVEVAVEEGKIVLFGFNVHNRAQSYANFKLFFNALLYSDSISSISL